MTVPQWNDRLRRRLRLRDVDVLLAVIQAGSMGRAANLLNMSQPAVSKAIAQLERALGVRLLDRSRQGVEPTTYGRALIKRGVAMFDELRKGVEDIGHLSDPAAGEVRAGGSDHMTSAVFAPVLKDLLARHSRMSSFISIGDYRLLAQELEARRIDVLVSRLYGPPSKEYSVEVLFEDPLVVVAAASHPLVRRRKLTLADLSNESWTLQPGDNTFGGVAIGAFDAAGIKPPPLRVATTSSMLRNELVATKGYLTILPRFFVLLPRRHPSFRILPVELPGVRHQVAIVRLKDRSLTPATERFVAGVRALVRPLSKG